MQSNSISKFDVVYRSLLLSKLFTNGWGKPEHLKSIFELREKLANSKNAIKCVYPQPYPVVITKKHDHSMYRILEGQFVSPAANLLPGVLPEEAITSHFQMVLPKDWSSSYMNTKPIVVQYAGTGDHYYWRRRHLMALPMIKERKIGSVIIECPFYGLRKPKAQLRSSLQNVSDLLAMGACLILESLVIFQWCEQEGFGPLAAHGISMGGHMASLAASAWPKPIALVPCLSSTTCSLTFTQGVMTGSIPWEMLCKQYEQVNAYRKEVLEIRHQGNAFLSGNEVKESLKLALTETEKESLMHSSIHNEESFFSGGIPDPMEFQLGSVYKRNKTAGYISYLTNVERWKELPYAISTIAKNNISSTKEALHREAIHFMRDMMDQATHLSNYDVPVDPSLIILVAAEKDAYQPKEGVSALSKLWPGSETRYIKDAGHVSSYIFKQRIFRQAIYDAMDRILAKYWQT